MIQGLDDISELWPMWQVWFETVEETHTALEPLVFYRSPQPNRSWVTAAGTVLDTASIVASTLDRPRDPQAELCIRAGYICLRRIAVLFGIPFAEDPDPAGPISVTREEYDAVCAALEKVGIPLKADREQAWRDFRGWRVNYDAVLVGLAVMTIAPRGFWSSDRVSRVRPLFATSVRSAQRAARMAMAGELPDESTAVGEDGNR
jgi:hypothetical protein